MDNYSSSQAGPSSEAGDRSHKYGSSCTSCRRRKQKCDAGYPVCGRCQKSGESCTYEGNQRRVPSSVLMPILSDMVQFLRELSSSDSKSDNNTKGIITKYLSSVELPDAIHFGTSQLARRAAGLQDENVLDGRVMPTQDDDHSMLKEDRQNEPEGDGGEVDELLMQMSLAEDGQNRHFGMTSFLWETPSASVLERLQNRAAEEKLDSSPHTNLTSALMKHNKKTNGEVWATEEGGIVSPESNEAGLLKANSSMLSNWENLAFHKLELEHDGESAKMMIHLLKTFFSWQYGQHCVVYRPVFLRDMALGGPYFNRFLLNVMCTSAARCSDYHVENGSPSHRSGTKTPSAALGSDYLVTAKLLLAQEMDKPSSIPTIQGLLLLGQRECSCGNLSAGWQYTGMAFRAMRDLGIHLNVSRLPIFGYGTLSAEDREIRRRVFWAAYTWDKIISLALGRTPTFNAWQNVSPGPIVDDTEDDDDWCPHFWDPALTLEMADYPQQKALTTLNNRNYIKLSEIIQKIIMRLYHGRPNIATSLEFTKDMHSRLIIWFENLPSSIKLDVNNLPQHCPPPHIFMTNCLYRATLILLYRLFLQFDVPFRFQVPAELGAQAASTCTQMATEIHELFMLYNKTFKLRNMTYTTSWSMYSAATINAMDFRNPDPAISTKASPRLVFSLHVLEKGALHSPGIERSIELIKQKLRAPPPRIVKRQLQNPDKPGSKRAHQTSIASNLEFQPDQAQYQAQISNVPSSQAMLSIPGISLESLPPPMTSLQPQDQMVFPNSTYNQAYILDDPQLGHDDDFMRLMNELGQASDSQTGRGGYDLMSGLMAMPSSTSQDTQWALNDWAELWNSG